MLNSPHVLNADLIVTDIIEEAGLLSKELNKPVVAIFSFYVALVVTQTDSKFEEISQPKPFRFHDYINASDLVISRGGYGTISEILAYGI